MRRFPRRTVPAFVRLAAALAFLAALVCLAPAATAVTKTWIGGTGQWDVSGNWTPSGQPQTYNDVYLTQSDATGPGTMTLNMPNSYALNVTTEYVGYSGKGAVTQSAGTNNAAELYLGYSAGSNGSYTITGGTLSSIGAFVGRYPTRAPKRIHGGNS